MDDLIITFLRARLDEDKQRAREAAMVIGRTGYEGGVLVDPPARWGDDLVADGQRWGASYATVKRMRQAGEKSQVVAECGGFGSRPVAEHIAHHDPAWVLSDIAAKRGLVDECERTLRFEDHGHWLAEFTLRQLALPYDEHTDYQPEWAPAA